MASLHHLQFTDARHATVNNVTGDQHNVHVSNPTINSTTTLDVLPYAEGASWNPELVCLRDTRRELFYDIWKWIYSADESKAAQILWLCDVAGAGKSAIAHTVARNCFYKGVLGSSFFFDRNIPDRRTPIKLFSTIARDLVRTSNDLVRHVSQILENDRSLASAGQSRQFDELILKPVLRYRIGRPVVIVIDALDEGCDRVTLSILRNQVRKLPGTFRILVTSRPTDDICTDLLNIGHVRYRTLDIHGDINQRDIALYIRDRLQYISSRRQLGSDWPGEQRILDFTRQAEGLFIWAYTVSEYLLTAAYPNRQLSRLLYERNLLSARAEAKMHVLYAEVLSACDWSDHDFVHDYKLVIGTIIGVKTPLSLSAIQSLHHEHPTLEVNEVLRPLSSVLTGFVNESHPIRIIHLSFRDFVTYRPQLSSVHEHFQVNEREHSQRLALLCLHVLNEGLTTDTPGTGYLAGPTPEKEGIPPLEESQVTEVLWYACRFWAEHIIEVEGPVSEAFLGPLHQFLTEKLILWMEVLNSRYPFQTLHRVREWLQRTFSSESALLMSISSMKYSSTIHEISNRLSYLGRREDALEAILEAVDLRRQLVSDSAVFTRSLNSLSLCLGNLGRREEALEANSEAVDLCRQLAADHPATFNADLALSLTNLSVSLSNLGHQGDALKAILEAVDLRRRLAADDPAAFNPRLAHSLNSLSVSLSALRHREDALKAGLEAVDLRRRLAADRPAAFNPDLARSLDRLSASLSVLGHREDALKASLEAVDLFRRLAADRPAAFNPDLASSLNSLSVSLSALGHREDALKVVLESVDLYRRLAADRPAAFNADLALSLDNLSCFLSALGHRDDALKAILESVDLRRRLAADRPAVFNAHLADSLTNLSFCLSDLGRRQDALTAILQATDLCQQLAADRPAAFNADLAGSLDDLFSRLSNLGRREEALEEIQDVCGRIFRTRDF